MVITGGDSSATDQDATAAERETNVADVAVTMTPRPPPAPHRLLADAALFMRY